MATKTISVTIVANISLSCFFFASSIVGPFQGVFQRRPDGLAGLGRDAEQTLLPSARALDAS